VNRVRIKLGARRDRVIPRLETRDGRNDSVEGNIPCGGIRSSRSRSNIIASGELEEFAKFEAAFCDDGMVFFLACVEASEVSLGGGSRTKLSQDTEDLPACDGANVNVVPQDGGVCRRHGECHFGESGIQRLNSNDSIPFLRKAKCAKKTFDLEIRVGRPNAHMITVLVRYTRSLNAEFHVNTIPVMGILEQLAGQSNGSGIWVLCVVNTLRPGEGARRQLAWNENVNKAMFNCGKGVKHTAVNLLGRDGVLNLGHSEVCGVATLAFFYVHDPGKCFPHAVLPFEVILFHALVVVALAAVTDPGSTHFCEVLVDLL